MAVGISTQFCPPGLHRSHRYGNTIGWSPVHVPGPAVSCWPLSGVVSEIVGRAVFTGTTWAADGPPGAAYATATKTAAAAAWRDPSHGSPFCLWRLAVPLPRKRRMSQPVRAFYESLTGPGTAVRFATLRSL